MCGIIASWSYGYDGLERVVTGLSNINNRGLEAVGVLAGNDNEIMSPFRRCGLVKDACTSNVNQWIDFARLVTDGKCDRFLGHVRYSTVGGTDLSLSQPLRTSNPTQRGGFGEFYLVHNGQFPYHNEWRRKLEGMGESFSTESDSEVMAAYLAHCQESSLSEAVKRMVNEFKGAFSIIVMGKDELVAARDRFGVRPLWWDPGLKFFSSETGGLPNPSNAMEIAPGEVVSVCKGAGSIEYSKCKVISCERKQCILEGIYFSRPDQRIGPSSTTLFRRMLGRRCAQKHPVDADIVCYVPNSGKAAGHGFSEEGGILFEPDALVRNFFAVRSRSFILPDQMSRVASARKKNTVNPILVCGKKVIIIDDSIVRSTTATIITQMFFEAGAKEVHWRIPSPRVQNICFLGINTPTRDELPGATLTAEQINCRIIKATSLKYLSLEDTLDVANAFSEGWCTGCFGGEYPFSPPEGTFQV